jgi:hypothetical protein
MFFFPYFCCCCCWIKKKEMSTALFVSHFSPEVMTTKVSAPDTKLPKSFNALANEDDFPLIKNIGVWTNG